MRKLVRDRRAQVGASLWLGRRQWGSLQSVWTVSDGIGYYGIGDSVVMGVRMHGCYNCSDLGEEGS